MFIWSLSVLKWQVRGNVLEISCTVYAILEQCFPKFIPQGPGDNGRFKKVMTQNTPEQSKNMLIFSSQPHPQVGRYFRKRSFFSPQESCVSGYWIRSFSKTRSMENPCIWKHCRPARIHCGFRVWCACDGTPFITAGNQVQFYAVISYR